MNRLLLTVPAVRLEPLRWVADIVFSRMLNIPVEIVGDERNHTTLSAEGRTLTMPSLFPDLQVERAQWAEQIPPLPLIEWDLADLPETGLGTPLPVLYGSLDTKFLENEIHCGVDILGSVFFMLSRFEEIALPDRDQHDRFPATASLAWKAGFLYRPIVDHHVEVLWALMKRLWPALTRKQRRGQVRVSCDVDQPFDRVGTRARALLRSIGGDILRRRSPGIAWLRARNFLAHRQGDLRFDPYYNFDWYTETCEKHSHLAEFYFIADHSGGPIDGTYEIDEPRVVDLIRKISKSGHKIGLHGSYNTFRDARQIGQERNRLTEACEKAGLDTPVTGNRQHYLRWDIAETPDHLEAAGLTYDSTGSYADRPGFRFGTSHPFPMWSWRKGAPLHIEQHPLVLMECSVISKAYLGMGHTSDARALMLDIKRRALEFGGDFNLLWHNSELLTKADRELFKQLL